MNFNNLAKPKERQNDFGGVFGEPILKDKTFFFFSYEGLRLRQPATRQSAVPDNTSRQQAPAGVQPFLNAYPIQNGNELGSGFAQFNGSYSNPSSLDAYSIRIDHAFTPKFNLFGRYNYSPSSVRERGATFTATALSNSESIDFSIHTGTIGMTALITPAISNDLLVNYSIQRLATRFTVDNLAELCRCPIHSCSPPASRPRIALICSPSAALASTARVRDAPMSSGR
ncbi:MAG: hypothetical protein JO108_13200 [Acidobacteriaceae bacterium]|nr:hypothetical protein [Acidobacteriaceae bacterium]